MKLNLLAFAFLLVQCINSQTTLGSINLDLNSIADQKIIPDNDNGTDVIAESANIRVLTI